MYTNRNRPISQLLRLFNLRSQRAHGYNFEKAPAEKWLCGLHRDFQLSDTVLSSVINRTRRAPYACMRVRTHETRARLRSCNPRARFRLATAAIGRERVAAPGFPSRR